MAVNRTYGERLKYLDIGAGIMTIWVMVFHALYPMWGQDELAHFPWLYFFMPWYFYKSGYMFKLKPTKTEWILGIKKLIVPFVVWSFIGWVAYVGWHAYIGDLSFRDALYSPIRS